MADNRIEIEVVIDPDKKSERRFDEIEGDAKKSGLKVAASFSKGFQQNLSNSFRILRGEVLALGSVLLATFGARRIIEASARQEDAINAVNQALRAQGAFTQEASQGLQEYASQLQAVTTFGDEAILEQLAFAQSLGATADQSKEIVTAAADLATALNIDLNAATRNVAKTLGGFAGELGEVIPQLKNLSQEQLRAGEGIRVLAQIYEGRASGAVKTFTGASQQTLNVFGDLLEEFGFFITRNPAVVAAFNSITKALQDTIKEVSEFRKSIDFREIGLQAIQFAEVLNKTITRPFTVLVNVADAAFQAVIAGLAGLSKRFVQFGALVASVGGAFGIGKGIQEDLTNLSSFLEEAETGALGNIKDLLLGDLTGSETQEEIAQFLENYRTTLEAVGDVTSETSQRVGNDVKKLGNQLSQTGKQLAAIVNQALVKVISNGIQRTTKALLEGGKAFQNFGKFVFSVLGDLAIKLGETLILTGIGIESLKALSGGAAIAAGAGLIALGTVLKSLGEGPGLGAAGEGAGGFAGSPVPGVGDTGIAEEEEREAPGTSVTVNVEGSVIGGDEESLATGIVNLINDAFDTSGVTVRTS